MIVVNNEGLPDTYDGKTDITKQTPQWQIGSGKQVTLLAANNPVAYQVARRPTDGSRDYVYGPEEVMAPGSQYWPGANAIRCRNAVAGSVSRVYVRVYDQADPVGVGYTPYTGIITAAGGVGVSGFNTVRKLTQKDVVNTAVETDLFNGEITLPAGALGTTGFYTIEASGDVLVNAGLTPTLTMRAKMGGVTWWSAVSGVIPNVAGRGFWTYYAKVFNTAATNQQNMVGAIYGAQRGSPVAATGDGGGMGSGLDVLSSSLGGTGVRDTTVAQLIELTAQWSAGNALHSMRLNRAVLTYYNAAA